MPGKPKIKYYDKSLLDGMVVEEKISKNNEKATLYVDKQQKSTKTEKVKTEKTITENSQKVKVKKSDKKEKSALTSKAEEVPKSKEVEKVEKSKSEKAEKSNDIKKDKEIKQVKKSDNLEQLSLFSSQPLIDYKKAKRTAKKFFEASEMLYDEFLKQNTKVRFTKKQIMANANEFLQALIVARELSKGEVSQNNLQFALEISYYSNLFEQSKNLGQLSQIAKTKLMQIPDIFMTSVVIDVKNDKNFSKSLLEVIKSLFIQIYPEGQRDFQALTKTVTNFLIKQGIKI